MQKKILSLMLVLVLLPVALLFCACGKSTKNNLSALDDEFYAIMDSNTNFVDNGNGMEITFDNHTNLKNAVNASNNQYKYLNDYNNIFASLICFSSEYIDECAGHSAGVEKSTKEKVFNELNALKLEIGAVNSAIETLAGMIDVNSSNVTDSTCLVAYENLLLTYEGMFEKAMIFNSTLVDIYYNRVLSNGNPNVANISLNDFDVDVVLSKLNGRIFYQRANLTQSYIKMYLEGGDFAHNIAYGLSTLDINKFNYSLNVKAINYALNMNQAATKANNNKQSFYDFAVKAYNLQEILSADAGKFIYACNTICLNDINANSSALEQMCASIIEENYNTITQYNSALKGMIDIVK